MKTSKKLLNAALLSSTVFATTWGFNKIIFLSASMKEVLFSQKHHTYSWRFGNISYIKKGSGSPVLLIHELKSTASSHEWNSMIDSLSRNHTVYALDLLGCGRSEKPQITYTNYIFVQLINDFVKDIIGEKTDIATSNSASNIGIMCCHSEPELYNRLLLINPASMEIITQIPQFRHKLLKDLIKAPLIGTTIYNLVHLPFIIKRNFKDSLAHPSRCLRKLIVSMYEACHLGGPSSRYFYASERSHFTNINVLHALKAVRHPIYIVEGEMIEDVEDILDSYISYNPSIEMKILADCKKYPHIEQPKALDFIFSAYFS